MIVRTHQFGGPNSLLDEGLGPGREMGTGHNVDNGGVAVQGKRGRQRMAVGEIEESVGQSGFVPDLQEDLGNLGRGEPIWEERSEARPPGL